MSGHDEPSESSPGAAEDRGGSVVGRRAGAVATLDGSGSSLAVRMARRSLRRQVKVVMFALGLPVGLLLSIAVITLLSWLTVVTPPMALVWTVSITMVVGLSLTLRPFAGVFTNEEIQALGQSVVIEQPALSRVSHEPPSGSESESPDSASN